MIAMIPFWFRELCCWMRPKNKPKLSIGPNGAPGILYAMDFDQTILNEDVQCAITSVLRGPIPDRLIELYGDDWANFCEKLIDYCIKKGETLSGIVRSIQNLEPLPGMEEVLRKICSKIQLHKVRNINSKLIVISGTSDFFVNTFLEAFDPPIILDKLIANHAEPTSDKRLKFIPYENQSSCHICPNFLCKGTALQDYILKFGPFEKVYYVGDGLNDVCAAQTLRKCDTLFVRKDYTLDLAIAFGYYGASRIDIKAKIVRFTDGQVLLKKMNLVQ